VYGVWCLVCSAHPLFVIYVAVAIIAFNKKKVMDTHPDFGEMHDVLSNLPKSSQDALFPEETQTLTQPLPFDEIIHRAILCM